MESLTRLRKFWFQDGPAFIWLLLAIPIMISFQSIVHEGTHSLAAAKRTGSFPKIIPFLMIYDGNFHNGFTVHDKDTVATYHERTTCAEGTAKKDVTRLAGWSGWPQMGAFLITVGIALIFLFVNIRNPIVGLLWRAWFIAACVDFMSNTSLILLFGKCVEPKDWSAAMIQLDHGLTFWRFITGLLWLIVLSHFGWVWWSKWIDDPLPDRGFWGYRWAAFVLGILSTISLIFYLLTRDDGIEYGSGWYIFGLILQLAGFWFYWIYYGLSLKHPQE
jgi:hypothetical protein